MYICQASHKTLEWTCRISEPISDYDRHVECSKVMNKVVQIWPGQVRLVYTQISPGHIWTTLYIHTHVSRRTSNWNFYIVSSIPCTQSYFNLVFSLAVSGLLHKIPAGITFTCRHLITKQWLLSRTRSECRISGQTPAFFVADTERKTLQLQ
jgi:hypothetical protein